MKKRLYIKTALSLMSITLLSSCLKDSKFYVDFTKDTPLVELPGAANVSGTAGPFEVVGITSSATAASPFNVAVNLAAPKPLGSAVTVTLKENADSLTSYNNANGTTYTLLPAAAFNSSSLSVTIPAGKNLVNLVIQVKTSLLNPDSSYVLPLTIVNGGGIKISNYNTVLYNLVVKNVYDGLYTGNGFVFRDTGGGVNDPQLGGNFSGVTGIPLTTAGTNSVSFAPIWATGVAAGGLTGTTLTIDPNTNKVTIASSTNPTLTNDPNYNNHYDPAGKVFYLSYKWGATPSDRSEIDTLTYAGPQ